MVLASQSYPESRQEELVTGDREGGPGDAVFDLDRTLYHGIGGRIPLFLSTAHVLAERSTTELLNKHGYGDLTPVRTEYRPAWFASDECETYQAAVEAIEAKEGLGEENHFPLVELDGINGTFWAIDEGEISYPEGQRTMAYHYLSALAGNEEDWVRDVIADHVEELELGEASKQVVQFFDIDRDVHIVSNNHQPVVEEIADELSTGRIPPENAYGIAVATDDDGRYTEELERNMFGPAGKAAAMDEIAEQANLGAGSAGFGDSLTSDAPIFEKTETNVVIDSTGDVSEEEVRNQLDTRQEDRLSDGRAETYLAKLLEPVRELLPSSIETQKDIFIYKDMDAVWEDIKTEGPLYEAVAVDA